MFVKKITAVLTKITLLFKQRKINVLFKSIFRKLSVIRLTSLLFFEFLLAAILILFQTNNFVTLLHDQQQKSGEENGTTFSLDEDSLINCLRNMYAWAQQRWTFEVEQESAAALGKVLGQFVERRKLNVWRDCFTSLKRRCIKLASSS